VNENLALQNITLVVVTGLWVSRENWGDLGVDVKSILK
jgi:hypothetical protein